MANATDAKLSRCDVGSGKDQAQAQLNLMIYPRALLSAVLRQAFPFGLWHPDLTARKLERSFVF
ncbi:MAG: hypothetical protein P8X51_08465, partial [Maritimibacter sp.]